MSRRQEERWRVGQAFARGRALGDTFPAVRLRLLFLHLVASLLLLLARPALANMAQPSAPGELAGILEPRTEGAVRVDRETLTFDVREDLAAASVKAVYRMTSTAAAPLSFDVAFVHVGEEGTRDREQPVAPPSVFADDQPVPFRTESDAGKRVQGWSELTGSRPLVFLLFHLDFAPGQTRTVSVGYMQEAGWDRVVNVNTTFTFEYLLSPAKRWASFGPLDIRVHVPPGTRVTSPTTAFTREGDVHAAAFATLPPGELTFSVMSTRGLWFGLAGTGAYWSILIAAQLIAVTAIGIATGGLWQQSGCKAAIFRILGAGFLGAAGVAAVAFLALACFPGHGLGYGGFFGAAGLVLLAAPTCVAVSFVAARSRWRRPAPFRE
jgi:hypothetical protein